MIEASQIQVRRGQRYLLDQVNLQIKPGEVVMLLGPNGAGKTTLLKVVTGELHPESGEIRLDSTSLNAYSLTELSQRRAVVSQSVHLAFPFTAMEVVQMGVQQRRSQRFCLKSQNDLGQRALARVQAEDLADRFFPELSGGEQQRVHLARALVQLWTGDQSRPQYLFLDEPTSALDLKHQVQVLQLIRQLASKGLGVCCVIHDLQLAAQYADRLLFLKHGKLIAEGPPEALITTANLQEIYEVDNHILYHPVTRKPLAVVG